LHAAKQWFQFAAEQGHEEAQMHLEQLGDTSPKKEL
jgi:TPR repeat protein